MANENTAAQPQPTAQQPQGKICYGDCFRCSYQQAWMCASMHSRLAMRTAEKLMGAINVLTQTLAEMKVQFADLQAKFDKEELINPLEEIEELDEEQEQEPWPETESEVILPTDPPKRIRKR